jgi:alkanesulfonate monooxygenase SsuD/methylene tetrahydromethanopterin reductase-like flavin-dependent oxidoreductase (luciferase family)
VENGRIADNGRRHCLAVRAETQSFPTAPDAHELIDRAARQAGRDPAVIRRIYVVPGRFAAPPRARATDSDRAIDGPPAHWATVLTGLALELGFETFILIAPPEPEVLRTFIEEVAPDVRERVAAARARIPPGTDLTVDDVVAR